MVYLLHLRKIKHKKRLLLLGIIGNILPLAYFKYTYFVIDILSNKLNVHIFELIKIPEIILPIGISFFSFHGISLLIDFYKKKINFKPSLVEIGMYIAFFPHQIAGPIIKAQSFFPQLKLTYPTVNNFRSNNFLILKGIFKKVILANLIGQYFVNPYFDAPSTSSAVDMAFAVFFYSYQLYFDFSAYTDMAIGLAGLLGYQFPLNFNNPYSALTLKEFWQKWHISLSSWLKEYIYIPLGGSRKTFPITLLNLLIVMTIGGLWHGANSTFFLWGIYHGLGLIIFNVWKKYNHGLSFHKYFAWLTTFTFVAFGWIIFRSPDIETFLFVSEKITSFSTYTVPDLIKLVVALSLLCITFSAHRIETWIHEFLNKLMISSYSVMCFIFYLVCFGSIGNDIPTFIYFQF
ncbi:DltB Predicted membrane protein involved in D-alanine export [Candidatus Methylopumilus universalis]